MKSLRWRGSTLPIVVLATILGAAFVIQPAQAAVSAPGPRFATARPGDDSFLYAVSAVSSTDVWAVGEQWARSGGRTMTLHWNGTEWSRVKSPSPGAQVNQLNGVSAVSSTDAWAVGVYDTEHLLGGTLILHWDGTGWSKVKSPNPGPYENYLQGVSAVSSKDAWAVGVYYTKTVAARTLILHWDGTAWSTVKSPNPGSYSNYLQGVSAVSSTDAWAVGTYVTKSASHTLILHWDGTAWSKVKSPGRDAYGIELFGVSAVSSDDAWAVGSYDTERGSRTLVLHCDGSAWSTVKSPSPGSSFETLRGVSAVSSTDAWAVGVYYTKTYLGRTLVLHWNGKAWSKFASRNPSSYEDDLFGVSAVSSADAWAVGYYHTETGAFRTLVLHWDGTGWSKVHSPNGG
jgi:hypothetical protein